MKLILTFLLALAGLPALAGPDGYVMLTNTGTSSARVIFNSGVGQVRVVSIDAKSDLSSSTLTFLAGTTSYAITVATTNSTNFTVASTVGLASNDVVIIETAAGVLAQATLYGTNATNIQLTAASGVTTSPGDLVWRCATSSTTVVGTTALRSSGECLYVADRGRPFSLTFTGTSAVSINSAVAKY